MSLTLVQHAKGTLPLLSLSKHLDYTEFWKLFPEFSIIYCLWWSATPQKYGGCSFQWKPRTVFASLFAFPFSIFWMHLWFGNESTDYSREMCRPQPQIEAASDLLLLVIILSFYVLL